MHVDEENWPARRKQSPHLLSGALQLFLGDGGGAAFTGRRSRCWGHDGNSGAESKAWDRGFPKKGDT